MTEIIQESTYPMDKAKEKRMEMDNLDRFKAKVLKKLRKMSHPLFNVEPKLSRTDILKLTLAHKYLVHKGINELMDEKKVRCWRIIDYSKGGGPAAVYVTLYKEQLKNGLDDVDEIRIRMCLKRNTYFNHNDICRYTKIHPDIVRAKLAELVYDKKLDYTVDVQPNKRGNRLYYEMIPIKRSEARKVIELDYFPRSYK